MLINNQQKKQRKYTKRIKFISSYKITLKEHWMSTMQMKLKPVIFKQDSRLYIHQEQRIKEAKLLIFQVEH